jgi:hypothetical protein
VVIATSQRPVPFAVDGARLAALAEGGPPPPHDDPDVRPWPAGAVERAADRRVRAAAGGGDSDLTISVTLARGRPPRRPRPSGIQRAVERIVVEAGGARYGGDPVAVSTGGQPAGIPQVGGP